jgi:hypothetical protein
MNDRPYLFPALTAALNDRPALVRVLYLSLAFLFVAFIAVHITRLASITTDENSYVNSPRGVRIVGVLADGASDRAGLRQDDIIVAVNGRPVRTVDEAMVFIIDGSAGKSLVYTIDRSGSRFDTEVVLADFGLPLTILIFLLTAALFFASSAVVLLRRPANPEARLFAWAMLATGAYLPLTTSYAPYYYDFDLLSRIQIPVSLVLGGITFASQYHLHHRYPAPRYIGRWPGWLWALFLGLIVATPSVLITTRIVPYNLLTGIVTTIAIIVFMEFFIPMRLKFPRNPAYPRMAGGVRAAGLTLLASFLLSLFINKYSALQAALLLFCAVPILLFYPIIRYRLFDLYFVVRRTSMYAASRIVLAVFLLAILAGSLSMLSRQRVNFPVPRMTGTSVEIVPVHSFPREQRDSIEKRVLLVASLLLGALLWIGWKGGRRLLDTLFHRGAYDYRRALQEFSQLSVRYSDPETLTRAIVNDLVQLMHLRGAAFAVPDAARLRLAASDGIALTPRLDSALRLDAPWLRRFTQESDAAAVKNLEERELFTDTGISFIAPILLDGSIAGCLFLGEKLSDMNYSKEDVDLLNNLTINIGDALRTIRFYDTAKEQERLKRELEIARRIQLGALPTKIPEFPGIDVAAISLPAHEVGGDFYDFLPRHDSVTFLIGDVSGKGMSAALYLARIQGILRTIESYQPELWELFVRLNTLIFEHIERNVYLTLAALRVDFLSRKIAYLRAGHLPMLCLHAATGAVTMHKPGGVGIGLEHAMFGDYLQPETIITNPGDVFVLVSDGITEAANREHEQYGIDRVAPVIQENAGEDAHAILEAILADLRSFSGEGDQYDDLTIVVVKTL